MPRVGVEMMMNDPKIDDSVKLAALRALMRLTLDRRRPRADAGLPDIARHLMNGRSPEEIVDIMDMTAEEVIVSLWRLSA